MCKKCDELKDIKPGVKRRVIIYDMGGRYADVNTYGGYIETKFIGNHKLATMTHVLHTSGRKYENTVNIHNCPFCGDRLV